MTLHSTHYIAHYKITEDMEVGGASARAIRSRGVAFVRFVSFCSVLLYTALVWFGLVCVLCFVRAAFGSPYVVIRRASLWFVAWALGGDGGGRSAA